LSRTQPEVLPPEPRTEGGTEEALAQRLKKAGYEAPTIQIPEDLYREIIEFLEIHVELTSEAEYDVVATKIVETWLVSKINELSYINFVGPPRSGKTRALEVIAALSHDSLIAATMSAPAIYRSLHERSASLFLDEIQQYLNEDRSTFLAILNAGQRKGQKAIITVKAGDGWVAQEFEVFGPKFLATTQSTADSLSTRCITIPMTKNTYRVNFRIDKA